jgi:NHLM bacteriocin system ABC transporter peptidase/ATP-binding protein
MNRVKNVPQIIQMETVECGAASLDMILAYYGKWVPLEQVRAECGVSRDGASMSNIVKAARYYGLEAKGKAIAVSSLREMKQFPCIVYWEFCHFVVLKGFRGNNALINDPARGSVKVPMDKFEESYTGMVIVLSPGESFEKGGSKPNSLSFVKKRMKGMYGALSVIMLLAAVSSAAQILYTSVGRGFIDHVLTGENPEWLTGFAIVMLISAMVVSILSILKEIELKRLEGRTAVVSSGRFMQHLLRLPMSFYSQRSVGDIQIRQRENETIMFTLMSLLAPSLINILMLILYVIVMFSYSPLLTCVGVGLMLINAFVARYISLKRKDITRSMTQDSGKQFAIMVSSFDMIETIRSVGAEDGIFTRFSGTQALVNRARAELLKISESLELIPQLLVQLANISVLCIGVWMIIAGSFTSGSLLSFTGFLCLFTNPLNQIILLGQTIQEMEVSMDRVEDVMKYPVDVPEDTLPAQEEMSSLQKLSGSVELKNVTFGYSPLKEPLIKDFNLSLTPGKWVALVGTSGSGKSTVAKLVSGLYKPWEGEISFDGIPLSEVPREQLKSSMAVVDQDIVTFEDSISDNVRLWDHSIEDFEIILACRDADIHDDITRRAEGYSGFVMPRGCNFSGGQLQRLEIARVLAMDPTILVLDEATSALDSEREAKVMQSIRDRGITCIVIAHRLSTIRDCDEIIVMDHGRIAERGTHEELVNKNGVYMDLIRND